VPSNDREVIHIAGADIQVGSQLRQRCAWCGALMLDYDLNGIAVPEGQEPRPGTWPPGELVALVGDHREGSASWVVEHVDGEPLPAGACGKLDPVVTR
jgi:hypothetical protein